MDSEKEDSESTELQQKEEIPGSSPEGVFEHPNQELFDEIHHEDPLQTDEQLKHNEEIVDQAGIMVDDGEQQYMNMVQITPEDMYEAGFEFDDLNHLTEEQLNIVIAVSQQRQAKHSGDDGNHHHLIHHEIIENAFEGDEAGADGHVYEEEGDGHGQLDDASMQIILTHDGGVNITDAKQQQFYISPTEIANLNIDLNNLSNDHVNQLLQIALPSMKESNEKNQEDSYNREVLDQAPSTSYHHQHHQQQPEIEPDISEQIRESLIGETVQIRTTDGNLQEAVVKYYKGGGEFKIQLMDGQFAYAALDQMMHQRIRNDHENYQAPMMIRRGGHLVAQKRGATSNDDLCPPVLKRSLATRSDEPHIAHSPNFCCPICDKKVYQKEPSYIVIRLPACDSCTREKIIVLDEQNS